MAKKLRCSHCGGDGHLVSDCKLKVAAEKELATEARRRVEWANLQKRYGKDWWKHT